MGLVTFDYTTMTALKDIQRSIRNQASVNKSKSEIARGAPIFFIWARFAVLRLKFKSLNLIIDVFSIKHEYTKFWNLQ